MHRILKKAGGKTHHMRYVDAVIQGRLVLVSQHTLQEYHLYIISYVQK